ncbi:putative deoxyribonuclease RhsC [Enhygromyxa salina]|uniref:Putative deoxyribonuclease RhsC n=1 Tax=Enhygromyxa salina TaxID=215803 RepID=A0A2S9YBG3_9BACT|nr:DUF6531 domain-containing protein [Enhygromyxa salina]PRQ02443.1 putative deoxyribonuclease RhsC [Enhygromyxa salina]
MVLQSSWFDPVLGLDTHIVGVPAPPAPAPVPTPVPMPFVGMVFDPLGLAIGAGIGMAFGGGPGLVFVNSMPVTNCGTEVTNKLTMPHIPAPGVMFIPPPMPGNDAELYFGSHNISLAGSYGVRLGDIALSCNDPVRLPVSVVLAIPKGMPVLNMRPMVPDLKAIAMALAMKAIMRGAKALLRRGAALFRRMRANSRFLQRMSRALGGCEPPANASRWRQMWHRTVRTVTGHPVDVVTGNLSTEIIDAQLPGPLPLKIERVYESAGSSRAGTLGYGWSHSLDESLWMERARAVVRCGDGREVEFPLWHLPERKLRAGDTATRVIHKMTLTCVQPGHYEVRQANGNVHVYMAVAGGDPELFRLVQIRSGDAQHEIRLTYDPRGRLEWVRDCGGRTLRFNHDERGRLTSLDLPAPSGEGHVRHRQYLYDDNDDLIEVRDAEGAAWRYAYQGHLMVQETDRAGLSFYFQYDSVGSLAKCVRTWGDGGIYDHLITYDQKGRKTIVENSLEQATIYEYNERNQVVAVTDAKGKVFRYDYDPDTGKRTLEQDPHGNERVMRYDRRGNLVEQIGLDGAVLKIEYDEEDRPIKAIDARRGEWSWTYHQGRLVESKVPSGERTWQEWRGGLVTRVVKGYDERAVTTLTYDQRKRVIATTLGNGVATHYTYDGQGRLTQVQNARGGLTKLRYDAEGRIVETEGPTRVRQRRVLDAEGNVLEFRDATRHVQFEYGHKHRVVTRAEAGVAVRYDYDTEDQLRAVINEAGEQFQFELDDNGRIIQEIGFDGRTRRYERDALGRVTKIVRASGAVTEMAYDALDRLVETRHDDGSFARFGYGVDGTVIRGQNELGEVELERDSLGRIVLERSGEHEVCSYYGPNGTRDALTTSLGGHVSVGRDVLGTTRQLFFDVNNQSEPNVALDVDALGCETTRRFDNGIELAWQHDEAGRPTARRTTWRAGLRAAMVAATVSSAAPSVASAAGEGSGVQALDARTYHWRGENQIAAIESPLGDREFDHDSRGRLVRERRRDAEFHRAMNAVGNVFKTPDGSDRSYAPGGQLERVRTDAGEVRYEYDDDGNRVRKIEPDGGVWHYRWNGHGMLREVERPDGARVEFDYDAFGRRTAKRLIAAGQTKETIFVWDRNVIVHELDADDEDGLVTWHWDPDGFRLVAREHQGARHYVATDHLGTPTELYDEAGDLAWRMDHDISGVRRDTRAEAEAEDQAKTPVACPFSFPGQYVDDETGLAYNRYRYFDPDADRYLSQDALGIQPGVDLYAYVPDTTVELDPLGLQPYDFGTLLNEAENTLDFSTARDGAVFWSGPRMADAQRWAAANGKTTLEQTAGGRYLDGLNLFDTPTSGLSGAEAAQVWDAASRRFAEGASGDVNVFSTGATRFGAWGERTWWRLERPTLAANPDVNSITRRRIDGNPCG